MKQIKVFTIAVCLFAVSIVLPEEVKTAAPTERLSQYVTASIGDASILNPILAADSASSDINSLVFEGLIDYNEELRFRGRLATSWEIYEEAYFYVNNQASIPKVGRAGPEEIVRLLRGTIREGKDRNDPVSRSFGNIKEISALPARSFETIEIEKDSSGRMVPVTVRVRPPVRIRLLLKKVDQELFKHLSELLGKTYFSSFDGSQFVELVPKAFSSKKALYGRQLLPAIERNPVIVFHLRPNVKFHDGHVFDAKDVKFTYEAIINPKNRSPRIADYEPVKKVEVVDFLTVRVVYKGLYSLALGTWAMGILPEHLLNDEALRAEANRLGKDPARFSMRESSFNRCPVGCGPFKFHTWEPDKYIKLRRFDEYWEGAPQFREYIYRIIPDLQTQEQEFLAGALDSYPIVPHKAEAFKKATSVQCFSGLSFGYTYIGYNMRREPFKDRRVRRALGMTIDVEQIIKKVLHNQGERITGPFVKQTDYYNHTTEPLPYDPKGALKLLEEAGWRRNKEGWLEKDGKRLQFTLITNKHNDLRKAILTIAQNGWKRIGMDVGTDILEWTVFVQERVNKLDFDALILGWAIGIEPDLYQIWHSSQTGPGQFNFVGFESKEADDLITKIRQEYNHDKQVAYCHRLHQIIAEEQPYTFLYVGKWTAALDKRIVVKNVDADGTVRYSRIKPTKTGNFMFHFNKWVKLPQLPESLRE